MTSTYDIRPDFWADATPEQWQDWHWQQQNRLRTLDDVEQVIGLSAGERDAFEKSRDAFRVAITPHYASLIDRGSPTCPVRMQAIPQPGELQVYDFELEDPLAEESHMPVPGITHRYPDRVLFYASHNCPMYCRHCTRKRKVSDPTTAASRAQIQHGLDYIRRTPAVRDVLVSGGDPLTLSDERLADILLPLRQIPHVEVIRLGTRNPVTLPQRITPEFCDMLRQVRPVYLHTHFNHPRELGDDAARALRMLLDAGCVLGNQMVLLKGINDDPETVLALNRKLLTHGCRPYYMLQCDMAQGITHFRTPLRVGLRIVEYLRGRIGGMGIPDFVVDLPGGGGKIELSPDYIVRRRPYQPPQTQGHTTPGTVSGEVITFRNWAGQEFDFVDIDLP